MGPDATVLFGSGGFSEVRPCCSTIFMTGAAQLLRHSGLLPRPPRPHSRIPYFPAAHTQFGRAIAAGAELFERTTRHFVKPIFGLTTTRIFGKTVQVDEETIVTKPFCRLLHFKRHIKNSDPRVLIVAPMSGHHATLLRGTVEAMLPDHDVYITDWIDAKMVPLSKGKFDLEDYISYVMDFIRLLGPDVHVVAVCQPAPAVLCAVSLLAQMDDPAAAALDDADGRADRHARLQDRRHGNGAKRTPSNGSGIRWFIPSRFIIPARTGWFIPASCSCRALFR